MTAAAQALHKRPSFPAEAAGPAVKRWKSAAQAAAWGAAGATEAESMVAAPAATEEYDLAVQSTGMRDVKTACSFKAEDHAAMQLLLQEPTSVLDLQTSPGRSSCSSASLSSQRSLSGDDTSFSAQNGGGGGGIDSCREAEKSCRSVVLLEGSAAVAAAAGAESVQQQLQSDQDIASWMDCMEDPHGPLALPDFGAGDQGGREGGGGGVKDFANTDIDFGFELGLDGGEHESFPSFPVAAGLMSDMLADLGMCLIDEPKFILLPPEGFQDAQGRLQEPDDSLSSMLSYAHGIRSSGVVVVPSQTASAHEIIHLLGSPQSNTDHSSCRQPAGAHGTQAVVAVQHSRSSAAALAPAQSRHHRSESWGSSSQAQVQRPPPPQQPEDSGLHLVHLLLACAEAIDDADFHIARPMLSRLRTISNPYGDPMQRIALYFADALSDRLATEEASSGVTATDATPIEAAEAAAGAPPATRLVTSPSGLDSDLAYQAFYKVLPFAKFAHFTANQAIYEAVGCGDKIHVVDLDVQQGLQWPSFMQSLAMRPGGPPHFRLTAVGADVAALQLTGRRLADFAQSLDVPFDYTPVVGRLESLDAPGALRVDPDEVLAINCPQVLHTIAGAGDQVTATRLAQLLSLLRGLNPAVVTLLEVEANHDGASLIARFVEALHYYCALFDALEGALRRDSADRFRIENTSLAAEIKDIVALEGARRRARHARSETWQARFASAGFRPLPLSSFALQQAQLLLEFYTTGEMPYKLSDDFGALILGWQDTPVTAVSSWRCC